MVLQTHTHTHTHTHKHARMHKPTKNSLYMSYQVQVKRSCMSTEDCQGLESFYIIILLNAWAFIINNAVSIEGDGHLLEATLVGNIQAFMHRM